MSIPNKPGNYYYWDVGNCDDPECCYWTMVKVFMLTDNLRNGPKKGQLVFKWGYIGTDDPIYLPVDDKRYIAEWNTKAVSNESLDKLRSLGWIEKN